MNREAIRERAREALQRDLAWLDHYVDVRRYARRRRSVTRNNARLQEMISNAKTYR